MQDLKECLRCATLSKVSSIGATLYHFVCDYCRQDQSELHPGLDITVKAMEHQLTEPSLRLDNKNQTHDGY